MVHSREYFQITNPNECVCLVVPKSELKKVIKSDQINLRSHELAVSIFLARMFQNSHYTSQRKRFSLELYGRYYMGHHMGNSQFYCKKANP